MGRSLTGKLRDRPHFRLYVVQSCVPSTIADRFCKVFYCDTERFEKRTVDNEVVWVDKVLTPPGSTNNKLDMTIVRDLDGKPYNPAKECAKTGVLLKKLTIAITLNLGAQSQVQICPWALDYANKKELKESHSWKTWGIGKISRFLHFKELMLSFGFAPADALQIYGRVIAHEVSAFPRMRHHKYF